MFTSQTSYTNENGLQSLGSRLRYILFAESFGVDDGARTHDNQNHNL
ncbi:MAG: hypothetical protein JWQ11_4154, partial [Rhizobacter sp.]|nr:hypothetical protein [Rhizobacter sp.]